MLLIAVASLTWHVLCLAVPLLLLAQGDGSKELSVVFVVAAEVRLFVRFQLHYFVEQLLLDFVVAVQSLLLSFFVLALLFCRASIDDGSV